MSEGRVVGYFLDSLGMHGYLWQNGQFTQLDYPGISGDTLAFRHQCRRRRPVGRAGRHGFTWENGVYTELSFYPRLGAITELC